MKGRQDRKGVIRVAPGTSALEIQEIVDSAPPGATVRLEPGRFVFDRPLEIARGAIALVGSGSDATAIIMDFGRHPPEHGIRVSGGATETVGRLAATTKFGRRTIRVDPADRVAPGDTLLISQPNDAAWLDSIGDATWRKDKPLRESLIAVERVRDDRLRLRNGVHFDFAADAATVSKIDLFADVELGGFSVEFPFGRADPADLSNTMPDYDRFVAVRVDGTIGAHIHDITVRQSPSIAFQFERALFLEAARLRAHGAHNKGTGGNGYAYQLRYTFESTLTGLEDRGMRHSLIFASWTSSVGNRAHVVSTDRDINFHGGRDHHNQVHVERSLRASDSTREPLLRVNDRGTRFGAPTDMTHNETTFDHVLGRKRDDVAGLKRGPRIAGSGWRRRADRRRRGRRIRYARQILEGLKGGGPKG